MRIVLAQDVGLSTKYAKGNFDLVVYKYAYSPPGQFCMCLRLLYYGGVPAMTCTSFTDITPKLGAGEFVCKVYSENEGIAEALISAGIADLVLNCPMFPILKLRPEYLSRLETVVSKLGLSLSAKGQ